MPLTENDVRRVSMADAIREEAEEDEAQRRERGETSRGVPEPTPCRTCGGGVSPGEGRQVGPWRQHDECADPVAVLARLSGDRRVTRPEADEVWRRLGGVPSYDKGRGVLPGVPTARGRGRSPAGAWEQVGEDDRQVIEQALRDVRQPVKVSRPRRSKLGACAWCGRSLSVVWRKVPGWRWPDNAPAVMCGECLPYWRNAGRPGRLADRERWAGWAVAALVGAAYSQLGWGERYADVPVFVEHPGADRAGVPVPWSWVAPEARHELAVRTLGPLPKLAVDAVAGRVWAAEYACRVREHREAAAEAQRAQRPIPW